MSSNTIRLILLLTACAFIGVSSLSPQESCAQTRVLLLPQDTVTNFENEVRNQNQFDFVVDAQSGQLGAVTLDLLLQYDVVVVWSNNGLSDSQSIIAGDALSDYIDAGGGVVEMVFSQFSTGFDIQGRWRSENYSCISATGDNIYSGGTLGQVADINHPIMAGINSVGTSNFRTGGASLLPGAQLIASYTDGQILVATRNDKAGRVVWVGFYPSQTQQLQGDWRQRAFQAIDHAAVSFRADAGGLYTITEGTPSVTLDASRSRGDIVSFAWDLDDDGEFDDADTPEVEFDTSGLDGPAEILVKVRVKGLRGGMLHPMAGHDPAA